MIAGRSSESRFSPPPRRPRDPLTSHDEENIRAELSRVLDRARNVASGNRDTFMEGSPSYDVASVAMIRLASLFERPEFDPWASILSGDEVAAIRTIRNIVAHAGYMAMDDDIFWEAVTMRVPEIVERLLKK